MTGLGCNCGMDALKNPLLARLCSDHDKILELSKRLAVAAGKATPADRLAALQAAGALRQLLRDHHKLEETQFLPWIARLDWPVEAQELVVEHRAGEDLMDAIVVALRQGNASAAGQGAARLDQALCAHIAHEGTIFKKLDA